MRLRLNAGKQRDARETVEASFLAWWQAHERSRRDGYDANAIVKIEQTKPFAALAYAMKHGCNDSELTGIARQNRANEPSLHTFFMNRAVQPSTMMA